MLTLEGWKFFRLVSILCSILFQSYFQSYPISLAKSDNDEIATNLTFILRNVWRRRRQSRLLNRGASSRLKSAKTRTDSSWKSSLYLFSCLWTPNYFYDAWDLLYAVIPIVVIFMHQTRQSSALIYVFFSSLFIVGGPKKEILFCYDIHF